MFRCGLENSRYNSRSERDFYCKFLWNLEDVEKKLSSFQLGTIPHGRGIVHRSVILIRYYS